MESMSASPSCPVSYGVLVLIVSMYDRAAGLLRSWKLRQCHRLWVTSGCADVATGKGRIKSADAKCGCVGKRQMWG